LVVGVSPGPRNMARNIVDNLLRFRFGGRIHLLGRTPGFYAGHPIHTNFDALPDGIDLAVLLTPAELVAETLDACGRKGIRQAVVESGGFAELRGDREGPDAEILAVAARHGIRFVGPNGLGVISRATGLVTPFMPMDDLPRPGDISLLAQSGGVGVTYLGALYAENLGLDRFVSLGNKLCLDETDFLEHLSGEGTSQAVCLYLEDVRRGRDFFNAIRGFQGTVIVQKAGITAAGHRAAASHTASLAVDDQVVGAALHQAGAVRVRTMNGMIAHAKAAALPPMRGPRLMLIARSGGHAVIAADAAEQRGFVLPPLPENMALLAREAGRGHVIRTGNPLDLGDIFDFEVYSQLLELAVRSEAFDGVAMIHVFASEAETRASARLLDAARKLTEETGRPVYLCFVTVPQASLSMKRRSAHPIFDAPEPMIEAMADLRWACQWRTRSPGEPADGRGGPPPRLGEAPEGFLDAASAWRLLQDRGFPVPAWRLVTAREDLPAACAAVGFPVVLKVDSPDVVHKSDVGGVEVGVENLSGALDAWDRIHAGVGAAAPVARLRGVLVQAMAPRGREVFLGARRDPSFGPLVMTGAGGIHVETLRDVTLRLAPLTREDAEDALG
ncbi:MAG: acetate--CoA ligase family protein, partial [Deltaproteobacteria bacterium]|nr:acetate--CoA ligase family protein [Deltaproteobacteria bacterium]